MPFEHKQCYECGRVTGGPFAQKPDEPSRFAGKVQHINEKGEGFYFATPEHPTNISHGICDECDERQKRENEPRNRWRRTLRAWKVDTDRGNSVTEDTWAQEAAKAEAREYETQAQANAGEREMRAEGARRTEEWQAENRRRLAVWVAENRRRARAFWGEDEEAAAETVTPETE